MVARICSSLAEFSVRSASRRCSDAGADRPELHVVRLRQCLEPVSRSTSPAPTWNLRGVAQRLLGRLRELREPVAERPDYVALPFVERGELAAAAVLGKSRRSWKATFAAERLRRLRSPYFLAIGEVLPQPRACALKVLLEVALEVLALGPDDSQVAAEGLADPLVERFAGATEGGQPRERHLRRARRRSRR